MVFFAFAAAAAFWMFFFAAADCLAVAMSSAFLLGSCVAAFTSAFFRRRLVSGCAAAATAFLTSSRGFIDRRPSAALCFTLRGSTFLVAFRDMSRLALLLISITGFAPFGHNIEAFGTHRLGARHFLNVSVRFISIKDYGSRRCLPHLCALPAPFRAGCVSRRWRRTMTAASSGSRLESEPAILPANFSLTMEMLSPAR
jgi:hypothetical protein